MAGKTRYLITLRLEPPQDSFEHVRQLRGLHGVEIDEGYGLVPISPKRHLYVIRVYGSIDIEQLKVEQPEVKGVHGDVRVGPMETSGKQEE